MAQTHFGYQTVDEADKARRVRGVFDSVAQRYDLMDDLLSFGMGGNKVRKLQTVLAEARAAGADTLITRASNNYGPNQFPEKVIPLFITNLINGIPVPLYGDGLNVRDWLHVDDHCRGIDVAIDRGANGEVYNIGGGNEVRNVDLTHRILELMGLPRTLITPVADRPGHDRRYALNTEKLQGLGWAPTVPFESGLAETVNWYRNNESWWRPIKEQDAAFKAYYAEQYGNRPKA